MISLTKDAPLFEAPAVKENDFFSFSLSNCKGKYSLLLFYPLDFTFVCPTELTAFQEHASLFSQFNCSIYGISVDSVHTHRAWLQTPKSHGGIAGVTFPLISDLTKSISRSYGLLDEEKGVAHRALVIIDENLKVQHVTLNAPGIGRNVHEALRIVKALQHHAQYGEVCPANWNEGQKAFKPTVVDLLSYVSAEKNV